MVEFRNIEEMKWPLEVWAAVEGDRRELIELLRSERRLSRRTRHALADWLEGNLQPVKLPRGRSLTESRVGWAWYHYDKLRAFIRNKGWHRKQAGRLYWPTSRLLEAVAQRDGVAKAALECFARRAKPRLPLSDQIALISKQTSERAAREGLARRIRSRK